MSTTFELFGDINELRVVSRGQVLISSLDDSPLGKVRPCKIRKLENSLNLIKACRLDDIPNKFHRHIPRRSSDTFN
jgi:hypothetical protein